MPRYSIDVRQGNLSDAGIETVFENSIAVCQEAPAICSDLARDVFARMTIDSDWQMDVADENGLPILRFRISAETIPQPQLLTILPVIVANGISGNPPPPLH